MTIEELHEGAEVYWTDPDNGISSGYYHVVKIISEEIVLLKNEAGSEVEVFLSELT